MTDELTDAAVDEIEADLQEPAYYSSARFTPRVDAKRLVAALRSERTQNARLIERAEAADAERDLAFDTAAAMAAGKAPHVEVNDMTMAFAGYIDIANEIDHPARGFKGYPGHRTLAEQREIVRQLISWVFTLDRMRNEAGAELERERTQNLEALVALRGIVEPTKDLLRYLTVAPEKAIPYPSYKLVWDAGRDALTEIERVLAARAALSTGGNMKTMDSLVAERDDAENRAVYAEARAAEYEAALAAVGWELIGTALPMVAENGTRWMFCADGSEPGVPVFRRSTQESK